MNTQAICTLPLAISGRRRFVEAAISPSQFCMPSVKVPSRYLSRLATDAKPKHATLAPKMAYNCATCAVWVPIGHGQPIEYAALRIFSAFVSLGSRRNLKLINHCREMHRDRVTPKPGGIPSHPARYISGDRQQSRPRPPHVCGFYIIY